VGPPTPVETMRATPAIQALDLSKRYGPVQALEGLDLTVEQGEIFGFLGPNGAGKTTTIRLLLDLIRPSRGRAEVLGLDCRRHSLTIRRRVGYLPGDVALYRPLTGEGLLATLRGRGEVGKELAQQLKTASFCVIFAGLGLTYALDNDFSPLIELVSQIGRSARVAVIPMVGHFNMRGLNQSLFQATGCVNRVSFANGVGHGEQFSLLGQVRDRAADCLLVVGSDPLSNLPQEVMANLAGVPIICLDPFPTATTRAAAVVLGTAASGIEVGGHAIRMDGVEVELRPARAAGFPSDEEVLNRLLAGA